MTEQEKREKVIRGLKRCIEKLDTVTNKAHGFNCTACPYFKKCDSSGYLVGLPLMRDVLALLKAQEPRVIDFDDVVGGDECWLEAVNGACGYADCYACTGTGEVQVFRCNFDNPQYIMASDYLKTWRCWTSRPSKEEMEATPWN